MKPRLKAVPGFPGTFATNTGQIWTYRNFPWRGKRWNGWRQLRQRPNQDGYPEVNCPLPSRSGGRGNVPVHRLVALAFLGQRPPGLQVTHLDGTRTNNTPENLAYRSPRDNARDKYLHGTMVQGESHPATKLSDEQCLQILNLSRQGVAQAEIARQYGVNRATVYDIRHGRTRPHLHQLH